MLENALAELSRHHDALRLRFEQRWHKWRQSYSATESSCRWRGRIYSQVSDAWKTESDDKLAAAEQASLNFKDGPLWRAAYFDLGDKGPGRLLFVIHHLAVDGISWRPLLEDLETAYRQLKSGTKKWNCRRRPASYQEWAERLQTFAESESLRKELPYWKAATDPPERIRWLETVGDGRSSVEQTPRAVQRN